MKYLYGDSTAFPLAQNFIDTLRDIVDACVQLLQADALIEQLAQQASEATAAAQAEQAALETLAEAVARALEPHRSGAVSIFQTEVTTRLLKSAWGVLESTRNDIISRRDTALMQAETKSGAQRAQSTVVLEKLLLGCELPATRWGLRWRAGDEGPADAQALATTPLRLEASFDVDLVGAEPWTTVVKVGDLRPDLVLQVPRPGGWRKRQAQLKPERLDRYLVTQVVATSERKALVVRRSAKQPAPGFEIVLVGENEGGPVFRALDDDSAAPQEVLLDGPELVAVRQLWQSISQGLRPLVQRRRRLLRVSIGGQPAAETTPGGLAQVLIGGIAPLVRELVQRSPNRRELVLKRVVGDGRREELFVSVDELERKMAPLDVQRRSAFEPFGLEPADAQRGRGSAGSPASSANDRSAREFQPGPDEDPELTLEPDLEQEHEQGPVAAEADADNELRLLVSEAEADR